MNDRRMIRVFFSWQNDLPDGETTKPIRRALKEAALELDTRLAIEVVIQEATSNSPGSPYIPYEIADKIRACDVFVGDITPVATLPSGKKCPNPNVTFELGMAAAHLGWDRIIMLLHTRYSELQGLPFDFDRHRISKFFVNSGDSYLSEVKILKALLTDAIALIVEQEPKRPRELEDVPETETKRKRDLRNIVWFMNNLNTNFLDAHIANIPDYLDAEAVFVADGVAGVVERSDFHLYDSDMEQVMRDVSRHLSETVSHDRFYRDTSNWRRQAFGTRRFDLSADPDEDQARQQITTARDALTESLGQLLGIIRERYLEVDIDETNVECAKRFRDAYKEMLE